MHATGVVIVSFNVRSVLVRRADARPSVLCCGCTSISLSVMWFSVMGGSCCSVMMTAPVRVSPVSLNVP